MRNSVRVVPYAHTQHIKVPKHFVYIQYRFVIQSEACCSTLHGVGSTPVISKTHPRPAEMYHCKGGPTCESPAYKEAKTLCICIIIIWMWNAFHRGFEPQPCHHNITRALLLSTQNPWQSNPADHWPDLHRRNIVRGDPYVNPWHISMCQTLCIHFLWM
jgi:hypothetical protein